MEPVKLEKHNFTYKGSTPEVGDLSCERRHGGVFSHWQPSDDELRILNDGGYVELGVFTEPIPPVSLKAVESDGG